MNIKLLGIIALAAIIGVSFTACSDDDGGGGGGSFTFNITNNHSAAITGVSIQGSFNNYQDITKTVSIAANGGTGTVTFENPGGLVATLTINFTGNASAYATSFSEYGTYNLTVTGTGSSSITRN